MSPSFLYCWCRWMSLTSLISFIHWPNFYSSLSLQHIFYGFTMILFGLFSKIVINFISCRFLDLTQLGLQVRFNRSVKISYIDGNTWVSTFKIPLNTFWCLFWCCLRCYCLKIRTAIVPNCRINFVKNNNFFHIESKSLRGFLFTMIFAM